VGKRFPLRMRLGVGGVFGAVTDRRSGTFTPMGATQSKAFPLVESSPTVAWFYVDPEIRVGVRLGSHVELSAGVEALMMFTPHAPTWDAQQPVDARPDGLAAFGADPIVRTMLLVVTPGLGVRYDF
jgi:hypothetical protein